MFDGDIATVLLAQESTDDGTGLLSQGMSRDVVGDGEEDEGMQHSLEL